jgi:predicted ribosomally synthesized peptide with SipW-like signal peptide
MRSKKGIKQSAVALALVGILSVGGIMAYFTDADTATNTFTVGKVSIDLQEPSWDPDIPEAITPLEEFAKDPQIKNDGVNDAFVFMEVVVPYANVTIAAQDGTKAADKAWTELFSYDVKDGWTEITGTVADTAYPIIDETAGTVTHLYAYGTADEMTAVAKDVTTASLFDFIRFANVVEDEGLEGTDLNVVVNGYAIQTTNIADGKTALDGNNADGVTAPDAVWAVLKTQAPSTDVAVPEDVKTDVKETP